jgi:hypothetical protein
VVIALTLLFAMNSNFRDLARDVFELIFECFLLASDIFSRLPGISIWVPRGWSWAAGRWITALIQHLRQRKIRRIERGKRVFSNDGRRTAKKYPPISVPTHANTKKDGASSGLDGGGTRRARWRNLVGSEGMQDDAVMHSRFTSV